MNGADLGRERSCPRRTPGRERGTHGEGYDAHAARGRGGGTRPRHRGQWARPQRVGAGGHRGEHLAALLAALAAWRAEAAARAAAESLRLSRQERREDDLRRVGRAAADIWQWDPRRLSPESVGATHDLAAAVALVPGELPAARELLGIYQRHESIDDRSGPAENAMIEVRDRLAELRASEPRLP
jgi:hypothetical protein